MGKQISEVAGSEHSEILDHLFYERGFNEFVQAVVDGHTHPRYKRTSTIYAHYARELDRELVQAYQTRAGLDPAECKSELLALSEKAKLDEAIESQESRYPPIHTRRV